MVPSPGVLPGVLWPSGGAYTEFHPLAADLTEARDSARKPGAKETSAGPALAFHDKAGSHYVAPSKGRRYLPPVNDQAASCGPGPFSRVIRRS